MFDHLLGRPSPGVQRLQVILTLSGIYIWTKRATSPPRLLEFLNRLFANTPAWKVVVATLSGSYLAKNIFLLLFMNAPEPLSRMYTRSFYRATWLITALDAGFLTAMNIRPMILRNICSLLFFVFYLVFADSADNKVRKYRALATTDMMRISWEKQANPVLRALTILERGHLEIRKDIIIPRPKTPSVSSFPNTKLGPISARLYFSGTSAQLKKCQNLIFQLPGGGFVTMNPKCHDDYTSEWARLTNIPIVSIDYGKAPEYPYPWALEEVFDAYKSIVESNGKVIGIETSEKLKIVLVGDSAGGNLATGLVMQCIESAEEHIPVPCGLILIYPCLSFDMACWMPPEQINMIRAESRKSLPALIENKQKLNALSPLAVPAAPRKIDIINDIVDRSKSWYHFWHKDKTVSTIPTTLSMTSRITYFTDRIIAPEMMRAMALLYLGSSPVSYNFDEEYYLSPVVAPDEVLARFPRTFFITGERDPLVDDTLVFASRVRKAKSKARKEWSTSRMNSLSSLDEKDPEALAHHIFSRDPDEMVRVKILEGISHAFMNMTAFLPEGRQATQLTSEWFLELFEDHSTEELNQGLHTDDQVHVKPSAIRRSSGIYAMQGVDAHFNPAHLGAPIDHRQRRISAVALVEVEEKSIMERRRNQLASTHLG